MSRVVASTIVIACALFGASCIVTDKIEFEDYVNNPPQVIEIDPDNTKVAWVCKVPNSFTVVVWDPDEGDLATYAAKLRMWVTSNPVTKECVVSELATTEQLEEYKTGVQLTVSCEIDLEQYQGLQEGTLIPFEVQISDLGYNQAVLPEGARTVEVVWVQRVAPDASECEGS